MIHRPILALGIVGLTASFAIADIDTFPGKASGWHGYARHDFEVGGAKCIAVAPESPAPGRPWIWRARFFGHEPQADAALLARGYHLAYCGVAGLFGAPPAVERWDAFYAFVTTTHGFAKKVALEGMSRGGLIIYGWVAASSEKVVCIYGDNPVCDIRSWPGGKGAGSGSAGDWKLCLEPCGNTEDDVASASRQFQRGYVFGSA